MAVYGDSPFSREDVPELVGIKTSVGGYFFDAYLLIDHESRLTITDHPVEEGANITDHSFVEPESLSMEIGMSDVCSSLVDGQFAQKPSRSVSAFDTLKQLQSDRIPITITTRLKTYKNMLVETITSAEDFKLSHGLRATVMFQEIIVVSTATVALPNRSSAAPHKTGQTNRGTTQPVQDNRSALRRAADSMGVPPPMIGGGNVYIA